MKKSTIEAMDLALEELLILKQEVKDKTGVKNRGLFQPVNL